MESVDGKRSRKPISYAILDCSDDDDFSDYTPPVKKKKEDTDSSENLSSLKNKSKVDDKGKLSSSQESNSNHKEKSSNKEKDEKRRDSDREKDKNRSDRDREKRDSDKEKDRKRSDRDRDKQDKEHNKDRDRHKKKHKHRDKERSKDSRDGSSSEERHKHKKDKKNDRKDKEREDKVKKLTVIEKIDEDFSDFTASVRSPKHSKPPLTSTQKSPGRTSPKKRLTVEERKFQRELEVALAISKTETCESPKREELPEKKSVINVNHESSNSKEICRNNDVDKPSSDDVAAIVKQDNTMHEIIESSKSTSTETHNGNKNINSVEDKIPEKSKNIVCEMEDPIPSTSTGMTSKRQRKKVMFFEEDSDSESFDGFEACEMSEESDFAPSPVKKKGKNAKDPKKTKPPKSSKGPVKEQANKNSITNPLTKNKQTPKHFAKENAVPVENGASSPQVGPSTISKPQEIKSPVRKVPVVTKSTSRTPEVKPREKSKSVSSNALSTVADTAKLGIVKVPFRSPVQSSSGTTPNFVPKSPNPLQRIGVRLGLSRRNFKPLHPGAVAK